MIVCSCNLLTKAQVLSTLADETPGSPRSPAQAYRCLGCAPNCGRCLITVRKLLVAARGAGADCAVGCATCPGHEAAETAPHRHEAEPHRHEEPAPEQRWLIAAE